MTMDHGYGDFYPQGVRRRAAHGEPFEPNTTGELEREIRRLLLAGQKIPASIAGQFSDRRFGYLVECAQTVIAERGDHTLAGEIERCLIDGLIGSGPILSNRKKS